MVGFAGQPFQLVIDGVPQFVVDVEAVQPLKSPVSQDYFHPLVVDDS